jgi:hypothetical protein
MGFGRRKIHHSQTGGYPKCVAVTQRLLSSIRLVKVNKINDHERNNDGREPPTENVADVLSSNALTSFFGWHHWTRFVSKIIRW